MAESQIEWTDATWNPIAGCSVMSSGGIEEPLIDTLGGDFRLLAI
ncbi:DUF5131 family protein [Acetobacter persici]|nr:DUF5131 family protein [Acetobacter persici]MCG4262278.1 DUF5131 family protein [Acetobacter senegalensis]